MKRDLRYRYLRAVAVLLGIWLACCALVAFVTVTTVRSRADWLDDFLATFVVINFACGLPALLLCAVLLLATARRAPRTTECLACGYDLRGNESGVCPECGRLIPTPQMRLIRGIGSDPDADQ